MTIDERVFHDAVRICPSLDERKIFDNLGYKPVGRFSGATIYKNNQTKKYFLYDAKTRSIIIQYGEEEITKL